MIESRIYSGEAPVALVKVHSSFITLLHRRLSLFDSPIHMWHQQLLEES